MNDGSVTHWFTHLEPGDADAAQRLWERYFGHFVDVCETIDYAHSRGILHRDLKQGYVASAEHRAVLENDPDFAPLQTHADWQLLTAPE